MDNYAHTKAQEIGRMFNCGPIRKETIKEIADCEHKTILQNAMRFAIDLIRYVGSDEYTRYPDDRNQASYDIAKALMMNPETKEILERPIGFI